MVNRTGLDLYLRDAYPNVGTVETSTSVQPDEEDLITGEDNAEASQSANNGTKEGATKRTIFVALGSLIILSFLMGVSK